MRWILVRVHLTERGSYSNKNLKELRSSLWDLLPEESKHSDLEM